GRGEGLVVRRVVHDTGDGCTVDLGRYRHAERGHAVEVVGRAVERVDVPLHARCARDGGALLADHAVVRASGLDAADDQCLRRPVDLGDHVGRARLDADFGAGATDAVPD